MDLSRVMKTPVPQLACLFLASRLALLAVGVLSTSLLPSGLTVQPGNLVWHEPAPKALEIWARWDSEWYLLIAERGYDVGDLLTRFGVGYEPTATAGFLPLYPILIGALTPLLGSVGAGVLISNLALFASLLMLYHLVRLEIDGEKGETAALASCVALLAFPSSLFLSAVYSESLFLALSIGVFLSARRGRFAVAGIVGGLAALTRPFGVLLVIPILWEWWERRREGRARSWSILWVLLIPAAFGLYMLFCRALFDDPLAFLHRQQRWRGGLSGPWQAFVRWWEAGPTAHGAHGSTFELVMAVGCILGMVAMVRRLRGSYVLYTAAGMAIALGSTLWSFSRLALTLFPFFMLIGGFWADGRRCGPAIYAFFGLTVSGLFMALFANWWWVG